MTFIVDHLGHRRILRAQKLVTCQDIFQCVSFSCHIFSNRKSAYQIYSIRCMDILQKPRMIMDNPTSTAYAKFATPQTHEVAGHAPPIATS